MQFEFAPQLKAFREEVRAFIAEKLPADIKARQMATGSLFSPAHDISTWMRILAAKGWSVPHWPRELGGLDWTPQQHFIFEEELYLGFAPEMPWGGTRMVGPVIYTFGSEEQKRRFLPEIRAGQVRWCQGFSEPAAGSDLASLRTRADLRDNTYVLNGQKIWTSGAYEAQWGFFLVKTDTECKPQAGMSFMLVEMSTPGISIRRIPQLNGDAHLCEVFLDNVQVPVENLVGERGKGWSYAKFLLDHERTASSYIFWNKRELRRTKQLAAAEALNGSPLIRDPAFRTRLARLEAEVTALEWSVLRVLADEKFAYPGTASVLKLSGSALQQAITEMQMDLLAEKSLRFYPPGALEKDAGEMWPGHIVGRTSLALLTRAATVFGGARQIQKNIIAKVALGL